ncbi:xanthine dehydrogenase family protein subunit M [Saccharopolyspora sp. NFXS83]|uniref:FAD binding domain-containing protein n=1 Tax=Saccharopolyspora sp. NFXS83 TaxID=2993560 RepID=UPI00224B49D9|nr:xanthine dehydrogenase family protein subunit M [Saccharopolyspora sp. NFXS83]MCX2730111.1 xanthine dehydrogenase family protein subunit M [Saccharopolyspora sp. NFXS83]
MREFQYLRPGDVAEAVAAVGADPEASYLAGGTTQLDLMKDGVLAPRTLVDVTRLPLRGISRDGEVLRVGAMTTMAELAADPLVVERAPVVSEALLASASPQLRNMATIGGNLLQRTRCRYFRDPSVTACNKRAPGSGCAAVTGGARMHAILGASADCIAVHGSDLAVALTALDAVVRVQGGAGPRSVPLAEFYRVPGSTPDVENVLGHDELIIGVDVPLPAPGVRSGYLKVRDRASYEFALSSAAVAVRVADGVVREARIALGGVGTVPWRAGEAERALLDQPSTAESFAAAAELAVQDPFTVEGTEFKVELARRTLIRALRDTTS